MSDDNPWVRVTDRDTGHRLSLRESAAQHGNFTVLKADAVGVDGEPLPPEFNAVSPSGAAETTKKEPTNG